MSIAEFWSWLQTQDRLSQWPPDRALVDEIGDRLHAIDDGLEFELTRRGDSSELAISAAGNAELFALVRQIVDAAPRLAISVVAFRQRGSVTGATLKLADGRRLSSSDVWFRIEHDEQGLGLQLFVRDLPDDDPGEIQNAVYLLLDNALGELDVVTGIAWIEWAPLPPAPETIALAPLSQLPPAFDRERASTGADR
jgi:hypothetical protein